MTRRPPLRPATARRERPLPHARPARGLLSLPRLSLSGPALAAGPAAPPAGTRLRAWPTRRLLSLPALLWGRGPSGPSAAAGRHRAARARLSLPGLLLCALMLPGLFLPGLPLAATPAAAVTCGQLSPAPDPGFTVCEVAANEDLRLFLDDAEGKPFGSFARLRQALQAQGQRLVFAMNAGMYHPDRRAVGLHIEGGRQLAPLVTRAGPGNFGMLPNGVFCVGERRLSVIESRRFQAAPPACRYASQSGPLLLENGREHPRFLPDSPSRTIRNGVGVSPDGSRAWFVISDAPVTFHEMATFLRDRLGVRDALYLDGSISKLYAPSLGREDLGRPMGPILGVVEPAS